MYWMMLVGWVGSKGEEFRGDRVDFIWKDISVLNDTGVSIISRPTYLRWSVCLEEHDIYIRITEAHLRLNQLGFSHASIQTHAPALPTLTKQSHPSAATAGLSPTALSTLTTSQLFSLRAARVWYPNSIAQPIVAMVLATGFDEADASGVRATGERSGARSRTRIRPTSSNSSLPYFCEVATLGVSATSK